MADSYARRMGEFLRLVLQYLWSRPDGATTREILAYIPRKVTLTGNEIIPFPSTPHFRMYEILVGSAMTAVMKAGWLVKENSKWFITEEGRIVCRDFGSAEEFYEESQRIFEEWRLQRFGAQIVMEDAEENAWDQIRQYLKGLNHQEFKSLVKFLLEAMEYHVIWMAPPEKTRGSVDLIVCADALGVRTPRLIVQVKHKDQPIIAEELRSSFSTLGGNDLSLVVSTSGFTQEAKDLIRTQPMQGISLMDLRKFYRLWLDYYEKLPDAARRHFPLKLVHFLSLESSL